MFSTKTKWIFAFAIVVAFALMGWVFHEREPALEGRTLSDWIVVMRKEPRNQKAHAAVRQLGSNSIPLLLSWLRLEDRPTLTGRAAEAKNSCLGWLEAHRIIELKSRTYDNDWKSSYRGLAFGAFTELGPAGKQAIPTLIRTLGDTTHNPDTPSMAAGTAFVVLPLLAPASIQPLVEALDSRDKQTKILAAGALGRIGPSAKAALPALEKKLHDSDLDFRLLAAETIGKLGGDPDEFVPVVIETLSKTNRDRLDFAVQILTQYKQHAKAAVPALTNLLNELPVTTNSDDLALRNSVMITLTEIDPETAAKISPKAP